MKNLETINCWQCMWKLIKGILPVISMVKYKFIDNKICSSCSYENSDDIERDDSESD